MPGPPGGPTDRCVLRAASALFRQLIEEPQLNRDEKRLLLSLSQRRTPGEQKRLKNEAKLRKKSKPKWRRQRVSADSDERGAVQRMRAYKTPRSQKPEPVRQYAVDSSRDGSDEALVVGVFPGGCHLLVNGEQRTAICDGHEVVVGDRLVVTPMGSALVRIDDLLHRRTTLSRPDPADSRRERVFAANVELVLAVVPVREPDLRLGLVDRILIAAARGGVSTAIVVTKCDLLEPSGRDAVNTQLCPYRDIGVPVMLCSPAQHQGIAPVSALVAGKTCVVVGKSGAGKSSLLNALDPRSERATAEVRGSDSKGRHTTTASSLVELGAGTRLIDTPGIRTFGMWALSRDTLAVYFPEFEEPARSCRFGDCAHLAEPDCEVHRAVADGRIARARYEAYRRIYTSLGQP